MNRREHIAKLLATRDMPTAELAREVGSTVRIISSSLAAMRKDERVHIARWAMADAAGGRCYPRPVYANGAGRDAPKPERAPRRRSRHRQQTHVCSVWAYAAGFAL